MRLRTLLLVLLCLATLARAETPASWTRPVEPVRIAGNLYYVGTEELGSYLLADGEGLILLDVPLAENVELVLSNVAKLGFDPQKIRILLASHAHLDHVGGFAGMKAKTGAMVVLSAADAELAARGGKGDPNFGDTLPYPAIAADRIVKDGEVVRLGGIAMTAILTPGHTPGAPRGERRSKRTGRCSTSCFSAASPRRDTSS